MDEQKDNEKKGMLEKLGKIKNGKKLGKDQFLIFILVGILFIIIALPTSESSVKKTDKSGLTDSSLSKMESSEEIDSEKDEAGIKGNEAEQFEKYLEKKLEKAISSMEGTGKVQVIVTVAASSETIVEKDRPSVVSTTTEKDAEGGSRNIKEEECEEETVFTGGEGGKDIPYVVKTIQPKVEGIVVITQGGGRSEVRNNITESIMALFNIEQHKIKVVKMKSE